MSRAEREKSAAVQQTLKYVQPRSTSVWKEGLNYENYRRTPAFSPRGAGVFQRDRRGGGTREYGGAPAPGVRAPGNRGRRGHGQRQHGGGGVPPLSGVSALLRGTGRPEPARGGRGDPLFCVGSDGGPVEAEKLCGHQALSGLQSLVYHGPHVRSLL